MVLRGHEKFWSVLTEYIGCDEQNRQVTGWLANTVSPGKCH